MDSEFKIKFKNPMTGTEDAITINLTALLEAPTDPDFEVTEGISPDTVKLGAGIEFPASVLQAAPAMALPMFSMWKAFGGAEQIKEVVHQEYDEIKAGITDPEAIAAASAFLTSLDQETIKAFLSDPKALVQTLKPSANDAEDPFAGLAGLDTTEDNEDDDGVNVTFKDVPLGETEPSKDDASKDTPDEQIPDELKALEDMLKGGGLEDLLKEAFGEAAASNDDPASDLEAELKKLFGDNVEIQIEGLGGAGTAAEEENKYVKKAQKIKSLYKSLGAEKIAKLNVATIAALPYGLQQAHDTALRGGDTLESLSEKYHDFFEQTSVEDLAEIYEIMDTEENSSTDQAAMILAEIAQKATPEALTTLTDHFTAAVGHPELDQIIDTALNTVERALTAGAQGKFRELGLKDGVSEIGGQLKEIVQAVEDAMNAAGLVADTDIVPIIEKHLYREMDIATELAENKKKGPQGPTPSA